ncbi:hypothetical protein EOA23_07980 [Mesorhizobium sp. M2A.F.Ca.ET.042.01.1.1]|uniref:hypothetical protein n=1 Tax=Mesorhizobium sp. M2A.F.Ca.ET.042.01.1.1 TaxID=2496745 RepID=UPI000FCB6419|nr:hypothetical protein [Mesorhizobium sp. M2A.F.Ca.ET.042.01.1.1]RUX33154.1 hypothetical protein EOA23_07980 [Mesorhizobium sp. M2A.F.Ca.ET.042.01.1.1]
MKYLFHFVLKTSRAIPTGAAGFSITMDGARTKFTEIGARVRVNRDERIRQADGFFQIGYIAIGA